MSTRFAVGLLALAALLVLVIQIASEVYAISLCRSYSYQTAQSIRGVIYCLPYNPSDAIVPLDDLRQ